MYPIILSLLLGSLNKGKRLYSPCHPVTECGWECVGQQRSEFPYIFLPRKEQPRGTCFVISIHQAFMGVQGPIWVPLFEARCGKFGESSKEND